MYQAICLAAITAFVSLDQVAKWLVNHNPTLNQGETISLIPGVLRLLRHDNKGIAFGFGDESDLRWIIAAVTGVVLLVFLWVVLTGRYRRSRMMTVGGVLIVAGGFGNFIDRVLIGSVTDFIHFELIDFPIFNIADCGVVVGASLVLIYFFFFYDDDEKLKQLDGVKQDGETIHSNAGDGGQ